MFGFGCLGGLVKLKVGALKPLRGKTPPAPRVSEAYLEHNSTLTTPFAFHPQDVTKSRALPLRGLKRSPHGFPSTQKGHLSRSWVLHSWSMH